MPADAGASSHEATAIGCSCWTSALWTLSLEVDAGQRPSLGVPAQDVEAFAALAATELYSVQDHGHCEVAAGCQPCDLARPSLWELLKLALLASHCLLSKLLVSSVLPTPKG